MKTPEELEAAIDADPDLADHYLVLGDLLQEHQDPRGELIGLERATFDGATARRLALQDELGPTVRVAVCDWHYGFVRGLKWTVSGRDEALVRQVLGHASCRHLVELELSIGGDADDDRQWLIDLVAESPRPCWRSVTIHSYLWGALNEPPAGALDLSPLWSVLPRLTSLWVDARHIIPGDVRSETLQQLGLDGEVEVRALASLLTGTAPRLEDLTLPDLDANTFAASFEGSRLAGQLTKLTVPDTDHDCRARILACCAHAIFLPPDDARYEPTYE